MAYLFTAGRFQAEDNSGVPLSGGLVYTYAAGTLTPLATYTNQGGGTPNANPVVLDSGGRASIWLGTSAYRIIVKTSAGVTLTDDDNITAGAADSLSSFGSSASAATGAGLIGFDFSLAYAASTAGWGTRLANRGYNMLRQVTPANWAGIINGTDTTTDHSSSITAGIAAATSANLIPYFPGKRWNYYSPTAAIDFPYGMQGDGAVLTSIYVDLAVYSGVVFRHVGGDVKDVTIRERNLIKTRGTLIQASADPVSGFTGHLRQSRVWVFGSLIALDIGNLFMCMFDHCRYEFAGTGIRCIPDTTAGNGYATTLNFQSVSSADNNQNWNIAPTGGQLNALSIVNGSTERPVVSASIITRVRQATMQSHYAEGTNTIVAFNLGDLSMKIDGLYLNNTAGIALGTNAQVSMFGVRANTSTDVLNCSSNTQNLTMGDCVWPSTGNTLQPLSFNFLGDVTINGVTYQKPVSQGATGMPFPVQTSVTTVSAAPATDVYRFVNLLGNVVNVYAAGRLHILAADQSSGANTASYIYDLTSNDNGTTDATLTQVRRQVTGTDPGVSATPFSLLADGASGAVKVQFTKNAAVANVVVRARFDGVMNPLSV